MMFSTKLCDESDSQLVESILVTLLVQLFDKKYNRQNSLVKTILTIFFKNFVLFSLKRAAMMLNAVTKLFFSIVTAKENIKVGQSNVRKEAPKRKVVKRGRKKESSSEQSEESESEFDEKVIMYDSDDSYTAERNVALMKILKSLDTTSVVSVVLALLNKQYIDQNGVYKLQEEFSVELLYRLLIIQSNTFKKVAIFKDYLVPLLDHILVQQTNDIDKLEKIKELWQTESSRVIQWAQKMTKFNDRLSLRLIELEEIKENNMLPEPDLASHTVLEFKIDTAE